MARKRRVQEAGATYHVTTHGVADLTIFPDDDCFTRFLDLVGEVAAKYEWRVRMYCLLSNHYHVLVTTKHANISDGMRDLNGRYARWFNRRHGRRGHVFDRRFHGEPILSDSHLLECVRYIALNPVRANLCAHPARWRWSSYAALIGRAPPASFLAQNAMLALFGSSRRVAIQRIRAFVEIAAWPDERGLTLAAAA
jgi:REP element-mobilizing transposase RayT